jgi:VWFA-related protein
MITQTRSCISRLAILLACSAVWGTFCGIPAAAQQIPADIKAPITRPSPVRPAKSAADPSNPTALQQSLAHIHIQSNLVIAPVTVMDRRGNFIEDLSKNDFRILDNGVPQQITEFQLAMQPIATVIVVQTNESVDPLLYQVRPLGSEFSGLLVGQKGVAALITFADRVHVVQGFTNDPLTLRENMRHLVATGGKARMNDALARAILMLSERPTAERRVIILFSEGYDRGSETTKQQIVQGAANADVAIYGLKFDPTEVLLRNKESPSAPDTLYNNNALPGVPGAPHTPLSTQQANMAPYVNPLDLAGKALTAARAARPKAKSPMEEYAALSGGAAYHSWSKSGLENLVQHIALEINSQYVLAYVPSTLKEPGFHRLQVEVNEPSLRVRTRAGYFYGVTTKVPTKMLPKIKPQKQRTGNRG